MAVAGASKRTPLYSVHQLLGARMVDFGGWEMPVQYSGIMDEHHAVRRAVGLFDVSHMVEFASERYAQVAVQGPRALVTLQKLTTVDVAGAGPGSGKDSFLPNEANSPACMRRETRPRQRQRNSRGEPHTDSMVAHACGCAGGEFSGSG